MTPCRGPAKALAFDSKRLYFPFRDTGRDTSEFDAFIRGSALERSFEVDHSFRIFAVIAEERVVPIGRGGLTHRWVILPSGAPADATQEIVEP